MDATDVRHVEAAQSGKSLTAVKSVLMFCPQYRPVVGGAERQAEKLSKELVRRGLNVKIITPRLFVSSPEYECDSGVEVERFPFFNIRRRFKDLRGTGPLNLLEMRFRVLKCIAKNIANADIIHTHIASPMCAFAMMAGRKRRVPVICKVASGGEKTDLDELSSIGLAGRPLARKMVRDVNAWVATTNEVRNSLLQWGVQANRIASIPNGVELSPKTHPDKIKRVRRFLYLGRISRNAQRDIPTLIQAFDRCAKGIPDAELALVGDGDLLEETRALASQVGSRCRIHLPGQQQPHQWLDWAQALVLPSRVEGLSNALLEAMAHSLPCIANDIPQNREVLAEGRAGLLVPIANVDSLTSAMMSLCDNDTKAIDLGLEGRRRVESAFSIGIVAEHYIKLYDELLHKRISFDII